MPRRPNTKPTNIYWLIDTRPETIASGWPIGKPFYCGKTVKTPEARLGEHRQDARRHSTRKASVAITAVGDFIAVRTMEIVPVSSDWCDRERHWIKLIRHLNPDCVNSADGGSGVPGWIAPPEFGAKIRAANTGRKHSAETRAKMKMLWQSHPERRAKLSAAAQKRTYSVETRAKISAAKKGTKLTSETREKMSAVRKGRKHSTTTRQKMSASATHWRAAERAKRRLTNY